jgi:hypothetical protein
VTAPAPFRGFGFAGYRSFAPGSVQRVGPLSKVHLLAGANNAGKSNILKVARDALPALAKNRAFELGHADRPAQAPPDDTAGFALAVAADCGSSQFEEATNRLDPRLREKLRDGLVEAGLLTSDLLWVTYDMPVKRRSTAWSLRAAQVSALAEAFGSNARGHSWLQSLSQQLAQRAGDHDANAQAVFAHLATSLAVRESIPSITVVGAVRQVGVDSDPTHPGEYSGHDLVSSLARFQNPPVERQEDRERFRSINRFVRRLFDDDEAALEVAYDGRSLSLYHNGVWLPLENYGTGLHQVVILAVAATVHSGHLICIEEPEVNLHPALQRKLLTYLAEETDNQYLIATHSAHLMDSKRTSISTVRRAVGATNIAPAVRPGDLADLSAELGYKASDLVQANMLIWVVGPSDRIYINHWIRSRASDLQEGVHYAVLCYGGALLRYLDPRDELVEEFISLPRINRNFFVVIDSDKTSARKHINSTKKRVCASIDAGPDSSGYWITKGYTIESYVPPALLASAVKAVHPGTISSWDGEQFANPLAESVLGGRKAVSKALIAREVVNHWEESDWLYDLPSRVDQLVARIRRANESTQL